MSHIKIYGAGMAGLLAARMLRHRSPTVYEERESLPHNHGALLRFRSDAVSRVTGIPFRRVMVRKAVWWAGRLHEGEAPLPARNAYSLKVTGAYTHRSIMNLEPGERWVAPADFVERLAQGVDVRYGCPLNAAILTARYEESPPLLSTIPMPALAVMAGWPEPLHFQHWQVRTVRVVVRDPVMDLYQTIYFPESGGPYRASFTGNLLTAESLMTPEETREGAWPSTRVSVVEDAALSAFGVEVRGAETSVHDQHYGKLVPLPDTVRQRFVLAMTERYGIYSVGRFATWRQLLLDDVIKDIETVDHLLEVRSPYAVRLHAAGGIR